MSVDGPLYHHDFTKQLLDLFMQVLKVSCSNLPNASFTDSNQMSLPCRLQGTLESIDPEFR